MGIFERHECAQRRLARAAMGILVRISRIAVST
jgi:hypothetical protein